MNKDLFFQELLEVFPSLIRGVFKKYTQIFGRRHITLLQYIVLDLLVKNKSVGIKDISGAFNISLPAASMLVERILKRGFVRRHRNPENRRHVEVSITVLGKKVYMEIKKDREETIKDIFSGLKVSELKDYVNILKKLERNVYKK